MVSTTPPETSARVEGPIRSPSPFLIRPGRPDALVDGERRAVRYLRLSVTDRCQYRCRYCLPADGVTFVPRSQVLDFDEFERLVRVFVGLGIDRVRLTGGEPTLRRDLVKLVARLARVEGVRDLAMTTNGERLRDLAKPLREAGLRRLNVSVDTLNPERFAHLTRTGRLARVLDGIDAAVEVGFEAVKVNVVVIRGVNDDELADLVRYGGARGVIVRFIEYMPIGVDGFWSSGTFVPVDEMRRALERDFDFGEPMGHGPEAGVPGEGPARHVDLTPKAGGSPVRVGFITAVSHEFCGTCNRIRVAATGTLQPCLATLGTVSLRDAMRSGADDVALQTLVQEALWGKSHGHDFEVDGGGKRVYQAMSVTGG